MNRKLYLILIFGLLVWLPSLQAKTTKSDPLKWINVQELGLEGQGWSETQHPYDRLPAKAEKMVRKPVWDLSRNSAGMCLHFFTNSSVVSSRMTVRFNSGMPHMTQVGVKGLDLYARDGDTWRWAGASKPYGKKHQQVLVGGMDGGWHEFLLYLPTYDGVDTLLIGIEKEAEIKAFNPINYSHKPIVFYGTSIMQGCSASRPGVATTAAVGRRLGVETINLGFSGNGRMEMVFTDLLSELEASCYVVDCLPNLNPDDIKERAFPFVKALREKRPGVPIILVESAGRQNAWLVEKYRDEIKAKNDRLKEAYVQLRAAGINHLYYVAGEDLIGRDSEGSIDAVHYTDVGYQRYVAKIIPVIRKALKRVENTIEKKSVKQIDKL